jgi:ATP-dependent DNA helicase PIF1
MLCPNASHRIDVFLGTGKSFLLKKIIAYLRLNEISVAITASTGMAALNIQGKTLHSFAGVGLAKDPAKTLLDRIRGDMGLSKRWRTTHTLIIDEG